MSKDLRQIVLKATDNGLAELLAKRLSDLAALRLPHDLDDPI